MRLPNLRDGLWTSPNARRLLIVSIIDSTGNGAFVSAGVVLFTTVLGLRPVQIGQGMAVGALIGLTVSVLWGGLADRIGPKKVLLSLQLWRAAGCAGYVFVHNFAGYVAVVIFLGLAERASPPILLAFVTSAVDESERVKTAAALRSIRNAGFTLGALLAALALLSPGRASMLAIVLGNSASFVIAAFLLRRIELVREAKPIRKAKDEAPDLVRKRPAFLLATVFTGLLSIHRQVLAVGLPLWIVTHHLAPKSIVSVLVAVNTVLVVALQVRFSRRSEEVDVSARVLRAAGWLMLVCTGLLALAAVHMPIKALTVTAVLVVATLALTLAEMWHAAGTWGLQLALSPARSRSRFLSVFNLGSSALDVSGAFILTAIVLPAGATGWIVLGVVLALIGQASPPVARWADRERLRNEPAPTPEEATVNS